MGIFLNHLAYPRSPWFTALGSFAVSGLLLSLACGRAPEVPAVSFAEPSSAGPADADATPQTPAPEVDPLERARVIGAQGLPNLDGIKITSGELVASEATLQALGLPPGIIASGPSGRFYADQTVPKETLDQVEFVLPFMKGESDKLVVVFRLPAVEGIPPILGIIPASLLKIDPKESTVTFKPLGLGEYQVAQTEVAVVEALPKAPPPPPTFQLNGSLAYTNFFGLESLGNAVAIIGNTGLRIIDIANPAQPTQVGTLSNANGEFGAGRGISLSGNLLIQTTNQGGVGAFNVTNRTAPTFRGGTGDAQGSDITIVGNFGFTATSLGIRTFTFANAMSLGGLITQTGGCNAIEGDNQILVAACASNVVGFATNNLPTLTPVMIDATLGGRGVALAGGFAYVAGDDGLRIYDVTNSAAPKLTGNLALPGALQVAVRDKLAVVLTDTAAILVDVTQKNEPKLFSPSITQSVIGGRRLKFYEQDKLLILDSAGLKVTTVK